MSFVRTVRRDLRGRPVALALDGDLDREHARLAVQASAWRSRVVLDERPVLWGCVKDTRDAWSWIPAPGGAPRAFPPFEAQFARVMAERESPWWIAWAFHLAEPLASLGLSRRTPRMWVGAVESPGESSATSIRWRRPSPYAEGRHPFAPAEVGWSGSPGELEIWPDVGDENVIPLRPWPALDDSRVKAFRKLAREGVLPPTVLVWVSGLQAWLVVDGHARWVAAHAERSCIRALGVVRPNARAVGPDRIDGLAAARDVLADVLERTNGAPRDAFLAELNRLASQLHEPLEWRAIDRAAPLDLDTWEREVEEALGGGAPP